MRLFIASKKRSEVCIPRLLVFSGGWCAAFFRPRPFGSISSRRRPQGPIARFEMRHARGSEEAQAFGPSAVHAAGLSCDRAARLLLTQVGQKETLPHRINHRAVWDACPCLDVRGRRWRVEISEDSAADALEGLRARGPVGSGREAGSFRYEPSSPDLDAAAISPAHLDGEKPSSSR